MSYYIREDHDEYWEAIDELPAEAELDFEATPTPDGEEYRFNDI